MYEIVIAVCFIGEMSDICADRMIAAPAPMTRTECMDFAQGREKIWSEDHPGHQVTELDCVPLAETGKPLSVKEVAPGVFVHEGGVDVPTPLNAADLANIGFIVGNDSVAVIDGGGSRSVAEGLYRAIRSKTDKPIEWLIYTHMHPDHTLGADFFQGGGTKIIGHTKVVRALKARYAGYEARIDDLIGPKAFLGTRTAFPDETFGDERKIDLGGRVLELRAWPTAHTDNDVTILDRQTGTLFTGDLVFDTHIPALDGSLTGWLDVLARIDGVKQIVPGHGKTPLPWPEGGDDTRRYLTTLAADTRKALRKGESISAAIKHIGEGERSLWELYDEFNARNATAAYKELEWE